MLEEAHVSLCVVCLTVIRTWWLLIVTNNWLTVAEAAGFPDAMLRLNMMGGACRSWSSLIYGLDCTEALLPWIFPSPFCVTGFQLWHCGGICNPRGSRELGFVPQTPTSTDVFICRGKQLQFKNVIALSMLSARTAVHSDECQLLTENQSLAFSSSDFRSYTL